MLQCATVSNSNLASPNLDQLNKAMVIVVTIAPQTLRATDSGHPESL
jgi:hypothetical protein